MDTPEFSNDPETNQKSAMSSGTKALLLVAVLVLVVVGVFAFQGVLRSPSTTPSTPIVDNDTPPSALTENPVLDESSELYFEDRNYDEAITLLETERAAAAASGDYREEAAAAMQQAYFLTRSDKAAAVELLIDVYTDDRLSTNAKANAAQSLFWILMATRDTPESSRYLSVEQANDLVFAGPFNFLLEPGEELPDTADMVHYYSLRGLEHALDLAQNDMPDLFYLIVHSILAKESTARVFHANPSEPDQAEVEQMSIYAQSALSLARSLEEEMFAEPEYNGQYGSALHSIIFALSRLETFGVEPEDGSRFTDVYDAFERYVATHDNSFSAQVFLASGGYWTMCMELYINDYDLEAVDVAQIERYIEPLINLPDEDLQNRGDIREFADRRTHPCKNASIVTGRDISPEFKDILINKIGGWREEQFVN